MRGASGSLDSGAPRSVVIAIPRAISAQTTKIHRQSRTPVRTPPINTPIPETSSVAAPHMPIAVPRRSPVKTLVRIDIDDGMIIAPPAPARAIPPIRTSIPGAAAAISEPIPKSSVPISMKRLRPKMSASRPAAIRNDENGIMNAVTVHCSSAIEVPNSLWICGQRDDDRGSRQLHDAGAGHRCGKGQRTARRSGHGAASLCRALAAEGETARGSRLPVP